MRELTSRELYLIKSALNFYQRELAGVLNTSPEAEVSKLLELVEQELETRKGSNISFRELERNIRELELELGLEKGALDTNPKLRELVRKSVRIG